MTSDYPQIRRRRPEVLAPAGTLDTLKVAVDFGADAVYAGGKQFGMRTAPKNLTLEDFAEGLDYAHARGAKLFVTCNILPSAHEVDEMNRYMAQLGEIGVDALIVSDIGVLMAARQYAPNCEVHISTQAGVTNHQAAQALAQLGASRIVLARELDLESIRLIRENVPSDIDIECFVHGSMCMAFSGRCLISQHTTGRDANHGDCAQSCRWKYHVVEEKRPGQFFPVEVTGDGTFLFNSEDMNLIEHVDEILDAGVTSLKIEGRAKSAYYVASMTNAYKCAVTEYMRQRGYEDEDGLPLHPLSWPHRGSSLFTPEAAALTAATPLGAASSSSPGTHNEETQANGDVVDDARGEDLRRVSLPQWLRDEPMKVTHREYSTGFYFPDAPASEAIERGGYINEWRWLGTVTGYDDVHARVEFLAKNKITPGMTIEFLAPFCAPTTLVVPGDGLVDADGCPVAEINNPARRYGIPCDIRIPEGAMIRARVAQKR
ncbi:U32 family peptidase [Schaalia sp. ZJ1691]|uniref:peptidase U32 family protein n=1 Tax=Schaalia sp. ZJ1691 TaxID=2709404 RepID=UPI0013EA5FCF|nr:U32 family peptidase [Schaalia sp. ZJ1691]